MTPEEKARQEIDRLPAAAGWIVHDYDQLTALKQIINDLLDAFDPGKAAGKGQGDLQD